MICSISKLAIQPRFQLMQIPYGQTRTYQDIAVSIGRAKAMRAVGAANGRNPLPIVIPCHRVIGANGSLTGFGGGLDTKKFLLELESRRSLPRQQEMGLLREPLKAGSGSKIRLHDG